MKKARIVIILLITALLLAGCGKVREVEEAIAAIGSVSLESLDRIEAAEALVAELSPSQQEKVINLPVLTQAREEYQRLEQTLENAIDAIRDIGTVTLDSAGDIEAAREACEELEEEGLTAYAADHYPILEAAEKQYEFLCTKDLYDRAVKAFEKGNYSDSMELIEELEETYPGSEFADSAWELNIKCILGTARDAYAEGDYREAINIVDSVIADYPGSYLLGSARQLGAQCYMDQATQRYGNQDLEGALNMLSAGTGAYGETMNTPEKTQLYNRIMADLEKLRPENGHILVRDSAVYGGYATFTVEASNLSDALVKLEKVDDPDKYVLFYVRAGEKVTISVKNGDYYAKYVTGPRWFGEEHYFGANASYVKADDIMSFSVSYEGSYIYYTVISITLYSTLGGNLSTSPIPEGSF